MSPTIWTRCAASCRPAAARFEGVRAVESQYAISTRKLVDSDAEQALLEGLIDAAKPPVPDGLRKLHYLLFTPFRHPPLQNGSRFGKRTERGIFYGSKTTEVALAEVAYYRLVFLEGTNAQLPLLQTDHTAFKFKVASKRFLDLTRAPFAAFAPSISSKTSYRESQELGAEMRAAGVDAFAYRSARDPNAGTNFGLFEPVFASARPSGFQTWACTATQNLVEFKEKNFFSPQVLSFERTAFLVGGALPSPAV